MATGSVSARLRGIKGDIRKKEDRSKEVARKGTTEEPPRRAKPVAVINKTFQ